MLQSSSAFPFTYRFRVRYAELDPQAVVFNSRYLEYADLVITEYWRAVGMPFTAEDALEFHVARAVVDYKAPLRADELVEARARVSRFGNSSMTTEIELHGPGTDDLRARIELIHVNVDLKTGKSEPIPEHVRARFAEPAKA